MDACIKPNFDSCNGGNISKRQISYYVSTPLINNLNFPPTSRFNTDFNQTVNLDRNAINRVVYAENGKKKLEEKRTEFLHLPGMMLLVRAYEQLTNPVVNVAGIKRLNKESHYMALGLKTKSAQQQRELGLGLAADILTNISIKKVGGINLPPLATAIWIGGSLAFKAVELDLEGRIAENEQLYKVSSPLRYANYKQNYQEQTVKVLGKARDLAKKNEDFRKNFDAIYEDELGASLLSNASDIIIQNKLDLPDYFLSRIKPDGTATFELGLLVNHASTDFQATNVITRDTIALGKEIVQTQGSLTTAYTSQQQNELLKAKQEKAYKENQKKLGTLSTSLSLISEIAGYVNPKVAREIQIVGGAAIRLASSINDFNNTAVNLFKSGALNNAVSGAILTGNVVAIGLQLFSMFGNSSPSPEQMILEQIQELRKEVQQLRKEMHERFDRIDQSLDKIYETMDNRFDKIDFSLGRINGNVDSIREELVKIHDDLNKVENSIYTWLEVGFKRTFVEGVNKYIGYKDTRNGLEMPFRPEYEDAENLFYSWAKDHSSDDIQAGLINNRSYSDENIDTELRQRPKNSQLAIPDYITDLYSYHIAPNINYLAQFPAKNLGLPALAANRLANPADWIRSSKAYTQLAIEWPDHAKQYKSYRIENIQQVGRELQEAIVGITTLQTKNGLKGNRQLWDALIAKYRNKSLMLQEAIKSKERMFSKNPIIEGINIWDSASQTINYSITDHPVIDACYYSKGLSLSVPENILNKLPNSLKIADLLGKQGAPGFGRVNLCLSIDWEVTELVGGLPSRGYPLFYLTAVYQGVGYYSRYIKDRHIHSVNTDLYRLIPSNWTGEDNLKRDFETISQEGRPCGPNGSPPIRPCTPITKVTDQIEQFFLSQQSEFYHQVASEITKTGEIYLTARNLSGSKALLDAYIALGMSQSLETNDLLHSLLYGSERVADEEVIKGIYEAAIADLSAGKSVPKVDLSTTINPRIDALSRVLNEILGQIDQYHRDKSEDPLFYNYPESLSSVNSTLRSLQIQNSDTTTGSILTAHPQTVDTNTNQPQDVSLYGTDSKGATLTYKVVTNPTHGSINGTAPDLTYTPTRGYIGKDNFTFKASNGTAESNVANIAINVAGLTCGDTNFKVVTNPIVASPESLPGFLAGKNFTVGKSPEFVNYGDFNKDGKLDLVLTNANDNTISILLGDGSGGFGAQTTFPVGNNPLTVEVGDFNGDGKQDLAVGNYKGNNVSILLGNGAGGFGAATNFAVGTGPRHINVSDLNGDGKLDLAVSNRDSADVSILLGNGSGGFTAFTKLAVGAIPLRIVVTDFNKDGKKDLAIAVGGANNISIFFGTGTGQFTAYKTFVAGTFPTDMVAADFNGDGNLDLAVANYTSQNVSLLLGQGGGNFAAPKNIDVGHNAFSIIAEDFNHDGILDLAVSGYVSNRVSVLNGDGRGNFVLSPISVAGAVPYHIIAKDFNGDGFPDLVVPNTATNNITLYLGSNTGTLTGIKPNAVVVGDFNGDGKLDLATANQGSNNLSIMLGKGEGAFTTTATYAVGTKPAFIALGDFNNDKKIDIAVTNLGSGTLNGGSVSILLGDGAGKFTKQPDIRVGSQPYTITTGDFNRDGKIDLAVTDVHSTNIEPNVYILNGNGTGGFTLSTTVSAKRTPRYISTTDVNKDGKIDLVISNANSNDVTILQGNGLGGFSELVTYSVGDGPIFHVMDDLDKDGNADLAVINTRLSQNLSLMLGAGSGRFEGFTNYNLGTRPSAAASADFDLDGNLDIAVVHEVANGIKVFSGSGYGSFTEKGTFGAGFESYSIASGDFNLDGKPDLVIANYNTNSVSILLNACPIWSDQTRDPSTGRRTPTSRTVSR